MMTGVDLRLPEWVEAACPEPGRRFPTPDARMGVVLELARATVEHRSGGPFAAAVFERETGTLVSVGVNLVVAARCSVAHAELLALMFAQRLLGSHDLSAPGLPPHELVASAEPCAMCLGAIPWSGVRRLLCGARDEDVRAIGFDEGTKPTDWAAALGADGIAVVRDVRRAEAAALLRDYRGRGGVIYNPSAGSR